MITIIILHLILYIKFILYSILLKSINFITIKFMDFSQNKLELGLRIKSYRNQNNLTQEEMSSIIGLEQSNLSNIETGKTFPDMTTLCQIINKANIEPNYLLDFLLREKPHFQSLDLEIVNLLINVPNESKIYFKQFLETLQK